MINLLVKFPDRQAAIDFGIAWGATDSSTEETATFIPPGVNLAVLGEHSYNAGTDDEPNIVTVDGWFVRMAAPDGFPVPEEIAALVVDDTLIDTGVVDEQGERIFAPRKDIPNCNWAGLAPKLPPP